MNYYTEIQLKIRLEVNLKEQENTWVEVYNFMSDDEKITFLDDNKHFIWRSEMDGFNHLYVFTNDGKLVNQVTRGKWEVTNFHGYNENSGNVYFTATAESPLERHLYRVQLFQEDHPAIPEKITSTRGVHDVSMSGDLEFFTDNYSNINIPRKTALLIQRGI